MAEKRGFIEEIKQSLTEASREGIKPSSFGEVAGIIGHQLGRIASEGWDQLKHSAAHGATEIMSAFYGGSAFVQYQNSPEWLVSNDAPKIDAPSVGPPDLGLAAEKLDVIGQELVGIRESMAAISSEMRADYQLRAEINAMAVEPIEQAERDGMSR